MSVTLQRPVRLPPWLRALIAALPEQPGEPLDHQWRGGHSNDVRELTFADGRILIVKRARQTWGRAGYATAAAAAHLIRSRSGLEVPEPLPVPLRLHGRTVQAYWRLPRPTLAELWPRLEDAQRLVALRSLGALMRRLHAIDAPRFGDITAAGTQDDFATMLQRDLQLRLLPAVYAHWPDGAWWVERLIERIPDVADNGPHAPVLTHNDLHMGNVLCDVGAAGVECVGLLDLDGVTGCCAARDVATFSVLHGPLFLKPLTAPFHAALAESAGCERQPLLLSFFRCVQLANQGFSSGLLGDIEHAALIRDALDAELRALSFLR